MSATTLYRLSDLTTSHGEPLTLYVGGYVENDDGTIGYHWTHNPAAASKMSRARALRAAAKLDEQRTAYRATRPHLACYPLHPIAIRSVCGGLEVDRKA